MEEPLMRVTEVARELNTSIWTVRYWVRKGLLPAVRVGRELRFDPSLVDRIRREGMPMRGEVEMVG